MMRKPLIPLLLAILAFSTPVYAMTPGESYLEITQTKVVYIVQQPQPFQSTQGLEEFLAFAKHNKEFNEARADYYFTKKIKCKALAFALRDLARRNGYDIETECYHRGEWYGGKKLLEGHVVCKVYIQGYIYIINPLTLKYWVEWRY